MVRSSPILKEYRECRVNTCSNRVWNGGHMCTTHRYRFKKYNSYDLPDHVGTPSILEVEVAPEWASGKCKVHGYLRENQMYRSQMNGGKYKTKGCRRCVLDRNIKKHYGFADGIDEFEQLVKNQNNKCAICNMEHVHTSDDRTQKRKLSIDHCHKTGKFRGIICNSCNVALGYFKDSIETLRSAINYLQSHQ